MKDQAKKKKKKPKSTISEFWKLIKRLTAIQRTAIQQKWLKLNKINSP